MRRFLALPLLACVSLTAALAEDDERWKDELGAQAAEKIGCQVEYLVNARSAEIAGRQTEEARLQCRDGRRFDAFRVAPDTDFQFHACATQSC